MDSAPRLRQREGAKRKKRGKKKKKKMKKVSEEERRNFKKMKKGGLESFQKEGVEFNSAVMRTSLILCCKMRPTK